MHPSYCTLASGLELEFKSFPLYFFLGTRLRSLWDGGAGGGIRKVPLTPASKPWQSVVMVTKNSKRVMEHHCYVFSLWQQRRPLQPLLEDTKLRVYRQMWVYQGPKAKQRIPPIPSAFCIVNIPVNQLAFMDSTPGCYLLVIQGTFPSQVLSINLRRWWQYRRIPLVSLKMVRHLLNFQLNSEISL